MNHNTSFHQAAAVRVLAKNAIFLGFAHAGWEGSMALSVIAGIAKDFTGVESGLERTKQFEIGLDTTRRRPGAVVEIAGNVNAHDGCCGARFITRTSLWPNIPKVTRIKQT